MTKHLPFTYLHILANFYYEMCLFLYIIIKECEGDLVWCKVSVI